MTRLAKPLIAESMPKPIGATEPATTPATIATAPSNVTWAGDTHESTLARWAKRSHSSRETPATERFSVDAGAAATSGSSSAAPVGGVLTCPPLGPAPFRAARGPGA